jgi:hypothetical protein
MGAIWVSKEAQALLDEVKKEMAEEGMGKPSYTDAVMRLGKNRKAKAH